MASTERAVHDRLAMAHMRLGQGVSADDAFLVMRGLPTMKLRFEAHDAAALDHEWWRQPEPVAKGENLVEEERVVEGPVAAAGRRRAWFPACHSDPFKRAPTGPVRRFRRDL